MTVPVSDASAPPGALSRLLDGDPPPLAALQRFAIACSMSTLFGLATCLREMMPVAYILRSALVMPTAFAIVWLIGVPSLGVLCTALGLPLTTAELARLALRSTIMTGLVLASLAPLVGLYVSTAADAMGASLAAWLGLAAGGGVGLSSFVVPFWRRATSEGRLHHRFVAPVVVGGFSVFVAVLALRTWRLPLFEMI